MVPTGDQQNAAVRLDVEFHLILCHRFAPKRTIAVDKNSRALPSLLFCPITTVPIPFPTFESNLDCLLDCARAQGLKVLDTYDAIAKSDAPLGLYGQWHMNDKGNALIADAIAGALR